MIHCFRFQRFVFNFNVRHYIAGGVDAAATQRSAAAAVAVVLVARMGGAVQVGRAVQVGGAVPLLQLGSGDVGGGAGGGWAVDGGAGDGGGGGAAGKAKGVRAAAIGIEYFLDRIKTRVLYCVVLLTNSSLLTSSHRISSPRPRTPRTKRTRRNPRNPRTQRPRRIPRTHRTSRTRRIRVECTSFSVQRKLPHREAKAQLGPHSERLHDVLDGFGFPVVPHPALEILVALIQDVKHRIQ